MGQVQISESVKEAAQRFFRERDKKIGPTKTGIVRSMPLSPELVQLIRAHIGERTTGLICHNRNGHPVGMSNLQRAWVNARGEGNQWRIYDLRHTHATLAVRAGASPDKVAQWLGHDKEVLMNIYFGELPDDEATARRIYETGPFNVEVGTNQTKSAPKTAASGRKTTKKSKRPSKKPKTR